MIYFYIVVRLQSFQLFQYFLGSNSIQQNRLFRIYSNCTMRQNSILVKNTSTLNSTKADVPFYSISQILKYSVSKISNKYSTSQSYYITNNIELAVQNKKCKLKEFLKDEEYNKNEEVLEQYYGIQECNNEIPELTQYYKYYTQTSILYQVNYFKMMHNYREKKKVYQYNKLKVLLNLSCTTQNSSLVDHKDKANSTPFASFYILSKLNQTNYDEQSLLIVKLNNKLSQEYGPNHYRSIEQIDQNYYFQKKNTENNYQKVERMFKKLKTTKNQKQNHNNSFLKNKSRFHAQRNNSCQSLTNDKKISVKHREYKKKKHLSMDNFNEFGKEEGVFKQLTRQKGSKMKDGCVKLQGNWMKSIYSNDKSKASKVTDKKINNFYKDNAYEMKEKILMAKEKIKKQKQMLKKKTVGINQSTLDYKNNRKLISVVPSQKNSTRNLIRIHAS